MSEPFNKLSPAQAERLAMLAEECAEVVQIVGKILRHGYESAHPEKPDITNRTLLLFELTDLVAVKELMVSSGDIAPPLSSLVNVAIRRKLRWAHHQDN